MAAPTTEGFDDTIRPDDVAAEETPPTEVLEEGEAVVDEAVTIPDDADEADVLEQHDEVPGEDDEYDAVG